MIGSTLSHYKIVEKIGEGGMGVIYRANDLHLNRTVALKVLPSTTGTSSEDILRFTQEARLTSSLNHPNILIVHDFDQAEGISFLVTECIDGETLETHLTKKQLSIDEILDYAIQVASGLEEAHSNGIIHRDLKAENIMITKSGQIKVMDFGLARVVGSTHLTQEGNLVGTFQYMSPEQINEQEIDPRSDIFSFGILLYRMLTGTFPFQGKTVAELLSSIVRNKPIPLEKFRKDIPKPLEQIIFKALEKNRDDRYQSIKDVKRDLIRLREDPSIKVFKHLKKSRRIYPVIILMFLLLVGAVLYFAVVDRSVQHKLQQKKSIAVLPILLPEGADSLSPLGLGLIDDIISRLVFFRSLQVKPTSAISNLQGKSFNSIEIGKELKVDNVLESRVYIVNQDPVLSIQLIDVYTGNLLWADRINFQWEDLTRIYDNISEQIVNALQLQLSEREYSELHRVYTKNPFAYELFLKGRALMLTSSRENNEKAIKFFESAIAEDELFAEAYALLSNAYIEQFWSNYSSDPSWVKKGEDAARKAIELNPQLSDAYASLGFARRIQGDYKASVSYAIQALRINPLHGFALEELSEFYRNWGNFNKAMYYAAKAAEHDPTFNIYRVRARIKQFQEKYTESISDIERAIRRGPQDSWLRGGLLAFSYIRMGELEKAEEEIKIADALDPNKPETYLSRAMLATVRGDIQVAQKELDAITEYIENDYAFAGHCAAIYSYQNRPKQAIEYLRKSIHLGNRWYSWFNNDSWFNNIRNHPEFIAIMDSVKSELEEISEYLKKEGY